MLKGETAYQQLDSILGPFQAEDANGMNENVREKEFWENEDIDMAVLKYRLAYSCAKVQNLIIAVLRKKLKL